MNHTRRPGLSDHGPRSATCHVGCTHGGPRAVTTAPLAFVGDARPSFVAASTQLHWRGETPILPGEDTPPARRPSARGAPWWRSGCTRRTSAAGRRREERRRRLRRRRRRWWFRQSRRQRSGGESDSEGDEPLLVDAWRVLARRCWSFRSCGIVDPARGGERRGAAVASGMGWFGGRTHASAFLLHSSQRHSARSR